MTARNISIEAYHKHIESGKAWVQWVKIFDFMLENSHTFFTRAEIAHYLGMRDSSVCGRVNKLLEAGLLVEHDRRKCKVTGSPAHPVGIKFDDPKQGKLI